MKLLPLIKSGNITLSLQPWKAMPKASKTPEGYSLKVNGKEVKHPEVMITGGGTFPTYTYLMHNNEVRWFSGSFEAGTAVEVSQPTAPVAAVAAVAADPKASKAEPQPTPQAKSKKSK